MIVRNHEFSRVLDRLCEPGLYSLDVETTGLKESDRIFSVIMNDGGESFYFNFHPYKSLHPDYVIPREKLIEFNRPLKNTGSTWLIHNAKFDLRMLFYEDVHVLGKVVCTKAMERVLVNNKLGMGSYSLAGCAERRGLKKDEAVMNYITKNRLYTWEGVPGKEGPQKLLQFYNVPFDIITQYGEIDARVCRLIGVDQQQKFEEMATEGPHAQALGNVVSNEIELTKTCFKMERLGIKINRPFVERAQANEKSQVEALSNEFSNLTGILFNDGRTCLTQAFTKVGEKYPLTEKGNPSFASAVLEEMTSPLAELVLKIRHHQKYLNTYYSSFLYLADRDDIIHPDMRQDGTETGRFSYSNPNLQNVPKEDDLTESPEFRVRASFVPRGDNAFVSLDYQQQEFRMMLDYAGQTSLIERVNAGEDVHQATAELMGVSRKFAKTINFGLLYGMGVGKLSKSLGLTDKEGKNLKENYFSRFPKIELLLKQVADKARRDGFITNWLGRRCHLSDPEYAYIMPNHLIQGGCADVIKVAMNKIQKFIETENLRLRMVLQVHDELLLEVPKDQMFAVPFIREIMETTYKPKNGIVMAVDTDHSFVSWSAEHKVKGLPNGDAKGSGVQTKSEKKARKNPSKLVASH